MISGVAATHSVLAEKRSLSVPVVRYPPKSFSRVHHADQPRLRRKRTVDTFNRDSVCIDPQQIEVAGFRFDGDDLSLRKRIRKINRRRADIGAAIDDERRCRGSGYLVVEGGKLWAAAQAP